MENNIKAYRFIVECKAFTSFNVERAELDQNNYATNIDDGFLKITARVPASLKFRENYDLGEVCLKYLDEHGRSIKETLFEECYLINLKSSLDYKNSEDILGIFTIQYRKSTDFNKEDISKKYSKLLKNCIIETAEEVRSTSIKKRAENSLKEIEKLCEQSSEKMVPPSLEFLYDLALYHNSDALDDIVNTYRSHQQIVDSFKKQSGVE